MSSFNNARYVIATLESLRQQTYPNVEIVVVDDCSTDDSVAVIERWLAACPIPSRFIKHKQNTGVCRVANDLITNANGKYISIIASDDLMLSDKISLQVPILEAAPAEVGILYGDISRMDSDGAPLESSPFAEIGFLPPSGDVFLPLLRYNFMPAMSALIRKSCFEAVGLHDENLAFEDWDIWLRMALKFHFLYAPHTTAKYRVHGGSMTHQRRRQMSESCCMLLQKQLGVSPAGDAIIRDHLIRHAESLYFLESPRSAYWLLRRWQYQKDVRGLLLLVFAHLRVPAPWASGLMGFMRKIKSVI